MGKKTGKQKRGPKKQHFVPKCYLSEFTDPSTPNGFEPYMWVFSKDGKEIKKKSPSNIFTENNLYTIDFNGEKDFSIETTLSRIEDKYSRLMETVKKKKPLSEYEHACLCIFIAAQLQRTLRYKRNQENFIQQLIDRGIQMSDARGAPVSEQVQEWIEYKKNVQKIHLIEGLPFLSNILKQMSIAFLCSPDRSNHPFISSDEPCVLFNPDLQWQRFYGPGFGQKNIQLTLALCPEITVMFSWANYRGYGIISASEVEDLNRMTRAHCEREFISSTKRKRRIWFYRFPVSPIFFLKFLEKEIENRFLIIRRLWLMRKYDGR